jgi:hypothetical protein
MARRRRSRKLGSSVILGNVKVCKMQGKKLVCKTSKMAGLGKKPSRRRHLGEFMLGAACRTAKGKFKKC